MSDTTSLPPSVTKEQLEIQKLKLEIHHINKGFYAQIANTIVIAIVGLLVLILFQWPQVQIMEATRQVNERLQVANAVIAARNIQDPAERAKMLNAIEREWPYSFVSSVVRSNRAITSAAEK